VLSTEALQDRHVLSLFNLADGSVPSLRIATSEARQSRTIGIRGIVPYDQNRPHVTAASAFTLMASPRQTRPERRAVDIERIEVLKGPQGPLFGRNTEGGALSLVTKAPTGEFDASRLRRVGNYGGRNR